MLHLSPFCKYYLYSGDADMRKGFDSLSGMVSSQMHGDILSGAVFIFINKKRKKMPRNFVFSFFFCFFAL